LLKLKPKSQKFSLSVMDWEGEEAPFFENALFLGSFDGKRLQRPR
jgi:hypothetical protein